MDKRLDFSGYDQFGPHIFPIEMGGRNGHIKLATEMHPAIAKYVADAKKIPGKTQLLIDALGAGEWWGANRNGDYFPEGELRNPGQEYGHETFMHYAFPFKHHLNKDPAQAYGDKVILSVYFPAMHRVQLVVAVHDPKCQDILQQVDRGEYPDVSMGCRVPYDQCSVCANRAKNRSQYCDDLKYRMNKILPDGRKVYAVNWRPKFFDISFVLIGAEKASHVLMKVASFQPTTAYSYPTKRAAVKKQGTIEKEVPMDVQSIEPVVESAPEVKSLEPAIPEELQKALAGFPLSEIFSTLAFLGIDPKPEEFQNIVLVKSGNQELASEWKSRRLVFDESSGSIPKNASKILNIGVENVNEKIAYLVRGMIPDRSCYNEFLTARLSKYAADENQWYPQPQSALISGIPLAATIAGLYAYLKSKAPEASMTQFGKAIERHPWLLGLLLAAGAGSAAAGASLLSPRPLGGDVNLDTKYGVGYTGHNKTALDKKFLIPLAMAPLAYMYSGVQRSRAVRGEPLGKFDRFMAERPDLAAIASLLVGPAAVSKGSKVLSKAKTFLKAGSAYTDFGLFSLAAGSKLLPAALAGAMIDAAIVNKISKIIEKRSKNGNAAGPTQ